MLNFKMKEDEVIGANGVVFPDCKNPYLFLRKGGAENNITSAPRFEHARRRILFSSVEEIDANVSETNRMKKL